MNTSTRRSMLAGAAALPALAAPAVFAASAADPIFAAIEHHRVMFPKMQLAARARSNTVDAKWSPDQDAVACAAALDADKAANEASNDAAFAFTKIPPTTIAGVLALLRYVEEFNAGAFYLEDWGGSKPMLWPTCDDEDEMDQFGYMLLVNVAVDQGKALTQ